MTARSAIAVAALALACAAPAFAQTAPPVPAATTVPWQPRPVIIIDPRHYLPSPTPRPHVTRRPLHHARPRALPTAEIFERHDTAPPPTRPPRAL